MTGSFNRYLNMKLCYWSKKIEIMSVLARVMAANDGTTPPVLFVVGTAGAGKSSLVTSFQRWARFLDVDVFVVRGRYYTQY